MPRLTSLLPLRVADFVPGQRVSACEAEAAQTLFGQGNASLPLDVCYAGTSPMSYYALSFRLGFLITRKKNVTQDGHVRKNWGPFLGLKRLPVTVR